MLKYTAHYSEVVVCIKRLKLAVFLFILEASAAQLIDNL